MRRGSANLISLLIQFARISLYKKLGKHMNSFQHSKSSVKKWGGSWEDYHELHNWMDSSKASMGDIRHRALRHHFLYSMLSMFKSQSGKSALAKRSQQEKFLSAISVKTWGTSLRYLIGFERCRCKSG